MALPTPIAPRLAVTFFSSVLFSLLPMSPVQDKYPSTLTLHCMLELRYLPTYLIVSTRYYIGPPPIPLDPSLEKLPFSSSSFPPITSLYHLYIPLLILSSSSVPSIEKNEHTVSYLLRQVYAELYLFRLYTHTHTHKAAHHAVSTTYHQDCHPRH